MPAVKVISRGRPASTETAPRPASAPDARSEALQPRPRPRAFESWSSSTSHIACDGRSESRSQGLWSPMPWTWRSGARRCPRVRVEQSDPPTVQPRAGVNDHTTTSQAAVRRWPGRAISIPSPGGGGVPMCYVITAAGIELLNSRDRLRRVGRQLHSGAVGAAPVTLRSHGGRGLRQARHEVHVAGGCWRCRGAR